VSQQIRSDVASCRFCGSELRGRPLRLTDRRRGLAGEWAMVPCTACGCWQRERPFAEEEVASWYEGYSARSSREPLTKNIAKPLNQPLRRVARRLRGDLLAADLVQARKGESVLEVGCGTAAHLKSLVKQGASGAACDLDTDAIRLLQTEGINAVPMRSPSLLPFPDNSFDRVLAMQVIEHVEEQEAFIDEIYRVLKSGGTCIIATPNSGSWSRKIFGRNWVSGWYAPYHLFLHSTPSLGRLLQSRGFNLGRVVAITPVSWLLRDSLAIMPRSGAPVDEQVGTRRFQVLQYIFVPLRVLLDACFSGSCQIRIAIKPHQR